MTKRTILEISPETLLGAYAQGIFPMSHGFDDPEIFWVKPISRGIIPLDAFHVPRSLKKTIKRRPFDICFDRDFTSVINNCALARVGRETTWINQTIKKSYGKLFQLGFCHTVEAWDNTRLVGGLYGISLGGAFFGESMFSVQSDASKICLVNLVNIMKENGYTLLDTQFLTSHLSQFGAIEIPQDHYERLLKDALKLKAEFCPEKIQQCY